MMVWITALLQLTFAVLMLGMILLYVFFLMNTWSWAQQERPDLNLAQILSVAGIEWGASIVLIFAHFSPVRLFHEAPPADESASLSYKQIPIIFVPSLHTGSGIFFMLYNRLKSHDFVSLWPFEWKSFLRSKALLEDDLSLYLRRLLKQSQIPKFRVVSFGSSRPIVAKVLSSPEFRQACEKWTAISAPRRASASFRFLATPRLIEAYADAEAGGMPSNERIPDLLLFGEDDVFCFPESVWMNDGVRSEAIPKAGHFSVLLHHQVTQNIVDQFQGK